MRILHCILRGFDGRAAPSETWELKDLMIGMPPRTRAWQPDGKFWTGRDDIREFVVPVQRRRFGYVSGTTIRAAPSSPGLIRPPDSAFNELHLLPSAPEALVDAAYRCVSRSAHPDAGGSHGGMLRLNGAYEALRKWRVAS